MNKKNNWFVFLIIYLAYTSIYIARVNLSIAGPELLKQGIADSAQIGILGSCFFVVFALGRVINGTLSDTAKPCVMLSTGLFFCGMGNILTGIFPPFYVMMLCWAINAYAQSMLWSSVLSAVTAMYNENKAKKKMSVMITSVAVGNILGIVVNSYLITHFGTRCAFIIPGGMTVILSIPVFIATKNIANPQKAAAKQNSKLSLLKNKNLLMMNAAAMFHGVMKENIGLWMAVYIVDTYLVDLQTSSLYILLIPTIGFAGRMVYPFLYRFCRENENTVSLLGFAVCIAAAAFLCVCKPGIFLSVSALSIIYMAVSIINTSMLSIYPLSHASTGNTASVSGIMDFSTYLGAGISSAVYGSVIKHAGYIPMFASWAILSAAALFIILKAGKIKC